MDDKEAVKILLECVKLLYHVQYRKGDDCPAGVIRAQQDIKSALVALNHGNGGECDSSSY